MKRETSLVPAETREITTTAPPQPVAVAELETKILSALDVLGALIPDLRRPHPEAVKKARSARTVSREAVSSIAAMVDASPALQRMTSMDTSHAREVLESMDAYRLVAERLAMLQAAVKFTSEARWAEVTSEAMLAFRKAVALADPRDAELAAHVATVRRNLGRRNGATGKKKAQTKNEPAG